MEGGDPLRKLAADCHGGQVSFGTCEMPVLKGDCTSWLVGCGSGGGWLGWWWGLVWWKGSGYLEVVVVDRGSCAAGMEWFVRWCWWSFVVFDQCGGSAGGASWLTALMMTVVRMKVYEMD